MSVRVFISYSHEDESHKDKFVQHLSSLKRSGRIEDWHDRKIVAGQKWEAEIDSNLKRSNIVIFLISSSFMSSEYCVGIEATTAMEMHAAEEAVLIPVIVRPTDWKDSELSKFQALPKDAKAITTWKNEDEAWLNVVEGVRTSLEEFESLSKQVIKKIKHGNYKESPLTKEMFEWLEDTEVRLAHRSIEAIKLSDIYTAPDVQIHSDEASELNKYKSACSLISQYDRFLLFGDEQHGKTALLKHYYKIFLEAGKKPLLVNGEDIRSANIDNLIKKKLSMQYQCVDYEAYLLESDKILLVDDFDKTKLNTRHQNKFIAEVCERFDRCIFSFQQAYFVLVNELSAFDNFIKADIIGFGNAKREDIIIKWISLGREQTIDDKELYQRCNELKSTIDSVIMRNIVPPKPIYIIMILQMFEASNSLNLELSSQGHCYQELIYQSFRNAGISTREFDTYFNVLTELAWWVFVNNKNPDNGEMEVFFASYSAEYLTVNGSDVVHKLIGNSILVEEGLTVGFKYLYVYYFFVGKKIAESYAESTEVSEHVESIIANMHREDHANILMFVTHHSKDSWIFEKLQAELVRPFDKYAPATLAREQLSFIEEFLSEIPGLILDGREVHEIRDEHNRNLDKKERDVTTVSEDSDESAGVLSDINTTFKGIEIAGQIIKNRHGSLRRDKLSSLVFDGISAGLRLLEYFVSSSNIAKEEIIRLISLHLEQNPNLSNHDIEKEAENAYLHITYWIINGVIRKIASSIGSKEAEEIYKDIGSKNITPAYLLLGLSIELHFSGRINVENISNASRRLESNPVCFRILKDLVVQHMYMLPVDFKEKQQLSDLLGISVRGQTLIGQKRKKIN